MLKHRESQIYMALTMVYNSLARSSFLGLLSNFLIKHDVSEAGPAAIFRHGMYLI